MAALLVIPLQAIHSQQIQHKPTVEQCRADMDAWFIKYKNGRYPGEFKELNRLSIEMSWCSVESDPDPDNKELYQIVFDSITLEQWWRYLNFLKRHNLYDQFLAEDAAGKR